MLFLAPPRRRLGSGKDECCKFSKIFNRGVKKANPVLAESNVTFIGINQLRENIGVMYGPNTSSPGGRALKHACSVMIEMAPIGGSSFEDENGTRVGHKVRASVRKNKVGKPFGKAEYSIKYTEGMINTEEELVELGIKYNIIERPNNVTYVIGEENFRGRAKVAEHVKEFSSNMEETIRKHYLDKDRVALIEDSDNEEEDNHFLGDF